MVFDNKADLVLKEENHVCISFKNYGPDLNSADAEKLFRCFYIADKSRTKKNTGLGLAIVKNWLPK